MDIRGRSVGEDAKLQRKEFARQVHQVHSVLLSLVGERWKGLSGPEDLPGADDLLGSFRWYDALCINQADVNERSEQVQLMRKDIYTGRTNHCLAWRGIRY